MKKSEEKRRAADLGFQNLEEEDEGNIVFTLS